MKTKALVGTLYFILFSSVLVFTPPCKIGTNDHTKNSHINNQKAIESNRLRLSKIVTSDLSQLNIFPKSSIMKATFDTNLDFSNDDPVIFINGRLVLHNTPPFIDTNLYVPLKLICDNLCINYSFNSNIAVFVKNKKSVKFAITKVKKNVKYLSYSQLNTLLTAFGMQCSWNANSKSLSITDPIYNSYFNNEDAIGNVSTIFCQDFQGTCVLIDDHTLLTCWHVIKDFNNDINNILVGDSNIEVLELNRVTNNDLAVLDVNVYNDRDYPKLNSAYRWNKAVAIGFPNTSFSINYGQITKTKLKQKYETDSSYTIENQADVKIDHGSSGGALYNIKYELIGITDAFDGKYSYSLPVK